MNQSIEENFDQVFEEFLKENLNKKNLDLSDISKDKNNQV